jgi:hypothetical protein
MIPNKNALIAGGEEIASRAHELEKEPNPPEKINDLAVNAPPAKAALEAGAREVANTLGKYAKEKSVPPKMPPSSPNSRQR